MKTGVRLGVFLECAFALLGQAKPNDVYGWDKVKWGMTLAEVRSVYTSRTSEESPGRFAECSDVPVHNCLPDRGPHIDLLDPVEIGDIKMDATVQAGYGSTNVASVQLADLAGSLRSGNGIRDFDILKTLLIQKYGSPADQETKRDEIGTRVTTVLWAFPSTAILLSLREDTVVYLEYKATDRKALDKL
jgi:hypothetical protein